MKGRAVETRVRKYGTKKKKKRRLERLKQGQTERKGRERKRRDKRLFVSGRHFLSRRGTKRK